MQVSACGYAQAASTRVRVSAALQTMRLATIVLCCQGKWPCIDQMGCMCWPTGHLGPLDLKYLRRHHEGESVMKLTRSISSSLQLGGCQAHAADLRGAGSSNDARVHGGDAGQHDTSFPLQQPAGYQALTLAAGHPPTADMGMVPNAPACQAAPWVSSGGTQEQAMRSNVPTPALQSGGQCSAGSLGASGYVAAAGDASQHAAMAAAASHSGHAAVLTRQTTSSAPSQQQYGGLQGESLCVGST